jgi:DNA-binding NarL/FixJ family response regulator
LPYREVFGEYGMRYEIGMAPRINDRDQVLICLKRALHDFSDREAQAFHPLVDLVGAALDYQVQVHAIQAKIRAATFPADPRRLTLTERETQVLALIATGCTNDQAARRLGISPRTVRKHLESVFAKANVPCRTAAVAWWCRQTQP